MRTLVSWEFALLMSAKKRNSSKIIFVSSTTPNHKWPVNLSIIIDERTKERVTTKRYFCWRFSIVNIFTHSLSLCVSRKRSWVIINQLCVACKNIMYNVNGYVRPFPAKSCGANAQRRFIDHRAILSGCYAMPCRVCRLWWLWKVMRAGRRRHGFFLPGLM